MSRLRGRRIGQPLSTQLASLQTFPCSGSGERTKGRQANEQSAIKLFNCPLDTWRHTVRVLRADVKEKLAEHVHRYDFVNENAAGPKVYSAVDLYCNQKGLQKRVTQNVTLCDSDYRGGEQKVVTIAVAPATAAKKAAACLTESELTLVRQGTKLR
jgi:hypothetical protein